AFLLNLGKTHDMSVLLTVDDTFDLVFYLELGLGIVFEIPALIFLLSRLGLISGPFLLRNMKYAVLLCFVVAAVITPTGDIPNMLIIGLPMIALYLVGVVIAYVFGKKRPKE